MPPGPQTTEHLLLNQRVGWRVGVLDQVVIDGGNGQLRLQTLPSIDRALTDAQGDFGGLVLPVSIAEDRSGRLYILDAATLHVKRFDPCKQVFEVLPALGGEGSEARRFLDPHRITISERNNLYVADTGNRRIQVFALKGLSLRAIWGPLLVSQDDSGIHVQRVQATTAQPAGDSDDDNDDDSMPDDVQVGEMVYPPGTWQPWDVAISKGNRAYVSDYANGLIHVFDAWGTWLTAFTGASAKDNQPPLEKPTSIAIDKEGHIYIVQENKAYVTVLDADGTFLQQVQQPAEVQGNFCPLSLAVDEEGNIYLCDGSTQRMYYYCRTVEGTFASPAICQSFYCTGTALIFDKAGNPLLLDAKQQQVLMLKPAVLYADAGTYGDTGTYYSSALDSEIYNCQWHRVLMSANIPSGTSITVATFTSEGARTIEEIQSLPSERWQTNLVNNQVRGSDWDCLILSQPGRYLWLRLTFTGESAATPTIQQIKVYFPRSSSLQYLPATYSEDPDSRDFLDRFLSIFDTMRGKIAQQITDIARYFDPLSAPIAPVGQPQNPDFLTWLASWIGLTVDRHWPDEKKRQLVRQAYQLYRLRGTPEGLRQHIRLYMDTEPYILEHFKLRRWLFLDNARLGDQSALWGKRILDRLQLDGRAQIGSFQLIDSGDPLSDPFYRDAHQFTVFLPLRPTGQQNDPTQLQTLQRIIEMAKPAHTQGYLQLVQPRFRIGIQSLVGLDTVISRYPHSTVAGADRLGYETVLGPSAHDEPPTMSIGKQSRIGSSTIMN